MSEDLKTDNIINEEMKKTETQEESHTNKHNPENQRNDNEGTEKKKKSGWMFWVFISCMVLFFALLAAKIYLSAVKARPELYGKYFYSWRINSADEVMIKGETYKKIKLNTIDPKKTDALNFREMAEEKTLDVEIYPNDSSKGGNVETVSVKGLLSFFAASEHMPRGITGHYTLVTETGYDFYEKLLKFKAYCLLNLGANKLDVDKQNKAKVPVLLKSREKESNFPIVEILKKNSEVGKVKPLLKNLLTNIKNRKDGYVLTNNNSTVPDALLKDVKAIINEVYSGDGKKKIEDKDITDFFVNYGKVIKVKALQSLVYYHTFTLFYYLTLDVELEEIPMDNKDRPNHVARMFAKIFSHVYEFPWNASAIDIPWYERFLGKKVSTDYSNKKIQEKYKKAMEKDEENIESLLEGI